MRKLPPEGYTIRDDLRRKSGPIVQIAGNDSRGVLFGIGRLLRAMSMEKGVVTMPAGLKITTAPRYPLRGHQLGYRPKTNSYDGWDLRQWEQYIRDLAVFGANSIELVPPRSDDASDSPHFPRPPMETMVGMSKLCDEYGLDVWIWYLEALDKDYSDPKTVQARLSRNGATMCLPSFLGLDGSIRARRRPRSHAAALLDGSARKTGRVCCTDRIRLRDDVGFAAGISGRVDE